MEGDLEGRDDVWLPPSHIDVTRPEAVEVAGDLKETQPGLFADVLVPKVDASLLRCRRVSSWLQTIDATQERALAQLEMPSGVVVEFVVDDGRIVSLPSLEGVVFTGEDYAAMFGEGASIASAQDLLARVFEEATSLRMRRADGVKVEELAAPISPVSVSTRMFEGDPTNPVWQMFERLHAHSARWWMWRRMGSDFHLARCSEEATFTDVQRMLQNVRFLLGALERTDTIGNVVLSGKDESWHLCWDDEWFFLERDVFIGRMIDVFDHVMENV